MEKKIRPVRFDASDLASMRSRDVKFPRAISAAEQAQQIADQVATASKTPEGSRAFRRVAMLTGK
jgi:hypothetical protein